MPPLPSHLYFTHLRAQNKTPTPSQLHLLPYLDALTTTSPTNRVKKGLYIHGPPGTGKTMLLNTLAIASFPPQPPKYFWQHPQPYTVHKKHYAEIIVQQQRKELDVTNKILCIDEVNVTDIADAMTFREIMESVMEKQNTVLVATSNREPDGILTLLLFLELYKNGLQRESLLPTIAAIKEHCMVIQLDGDDQRKNKRTGMTAYLCPPIEIKKHLLEGRSTTIDVLSRKLHVPWHKGRMAYFTFQQLCSEALSSSDYRAVVANFDTILLDQIPALRIPTDRNEVRRFIHFIDAAYESKTKLLCNALVPILDLFIVESGEGDESFAYHRTLSRLIQMSSDDWVGPEFTEYINKLSQS